MNYQRHFILHACLVSFFVLLGSSCAVFSAGTSKEYANSTKDGKGAVASVHPLATEIGLNIFEKGGNAVDAAIATAFALGVVDGFNSGIGGGCFILVRASNGDIIAIDGREMAPAAAFRDMYIRDGKAVPELSRTGALAIGVPGSVSALYELQKKYGELDYADVILPSVSLAEKGFKLDPLYVARLERTAQKLSAFDASSQIFLSNEGKAFSVGDTLVQKDLAYTYKKLAKHGPDYFYKGKFAKAVEKWMKKNGGIVTKKDFEKYALKYREPVQSSFMGYDIIGYPPPSSGGIHVAQILSMVELQNKALGKQKYTLESGEALSELDLYHWYIEASKLAFADRAYWLGDADFTPVPLGLLDEAYLESRASTINVDKASKVTTHGLPPNYEDALFNRHTTHLTAADKEGNWVAITTTLNTSFGSGVTIPGTGVMMNNQMDDFVAHPGASNAFGLVGAEANAVAPLKRPLSSMSPTMVMKNGEPVLTVGAAGGPTIISQVAQTIMGVLMLDMPLEDALARVRVHHQWKPDRIFIDGFADSALKEGLEKKGHTVKVWPRFGATQAISLEDGKLIPKSEPRIQ